MDIMSSETDKSGERRSFALDILDRYAPKPEDPIEQVKRLSREVMELRKALLRAQGVVAKTRSMLSSLEHELYEREGH
jgi:hypothetical protein